MEIRKGNFEEKLILNANRVICLPLSQKGKKIRVFFGEKAISVNNIDMNRYDKNIRKFLIYRTV